MNDCISVKKEKGTCDYCNDNQTTRKIMSEEEECFICKDCYSAWRNGEWDC